MFQLPFLYTFMKSLPKYLRFFSFIRFLMRNVINRPLYDVFTFTMRAKVSLYACRTVAYCHLIQGYVKTQELSARVSRINHKRNSLGRLEF